MNGNDNGNRLKTFTHPCMGTLFKISVDSELPQDKLNKIAKGAFSIADAMDQKFSDYSAESEISKFNEIPQNSPFKLSYDFFELLNISKEYHKKTRGTFEPASGALTRLWRLSKRIKRLPDQKTLDLAIQASRFDNVIIDKTTRAATKKNYMTRLDFGGIAKGYTADKMLSYMKNEGLHACSVSAGGDIVVGNAPAGKSHWVVKIKPYGDLSSEFMSLKLCNQAVSTSGNIEQSVTIGDDKYSHIIDPKTGLGIKGSHAVTVISPKGVISDVLATSISILGFDGLELLKQFPDSEAAIIDFKDKKKTVKKSPNFNNNLK